MGGFVSCLHKGGESMSGSQGEAEARVGRQGLLKCEYGPGQLEAGTDGENGLPRS
jgi:hypothetical protein